jgi:hypothetical protein
MGWLVAPHPVFDTVDGTKVVGFRVVVAAFVLVGASVVAFVVAPARVVALTVVPASLVVVPTLVVGARVVAVDVQTHATEVP